MVLISLLPIGLAQTWASVESGLWYARSAAFMQDQTMELLCWLRVIGNTIFAIGILALGLCLIGMKTGCSIKEQIDLSYTDHPQVNPGEERDEVPVALFRRQTVFILRPGSLPKLMIRVFYVYFIFSCIENSFETIVSHSKKWLLLYMFDFRLKVFYTVARRLNFTKAAEELLISQPAVTKHIKELESQFDLALFDRRGNKVLLSPAGEVLLKHTEAIQEIYRQVEFDLNQLNHAFRGVLHVGSSTSITQYVLPPLLARFHSMHQEVKVELLSGNTEQIEQALLKKQIEVGVIEGKSKRREIHYTPFLKDEIVLVCGSKNPLAKREEIRPEELKKIPLLLREPGSGTLEVTADALKQKGIRLADLQVEMQLGSTEAIKSYLQHSDCMAFVSLHAILRELEAGTLKIIEIKKLPIHRNFYFITPQGPEGGLPALLIRFLIRNHNI